MANVTVSGGSTRGVILTPGNTALLAVAQSALDAINARVAAGTDVALLYVPGTALPDHVLPADLTIATAASLTVTAKTGLDGIDVTATTPVSITDDTATPVSIIAGSGGLVVNRTASGDGSAVIVATGGVNDINLGSGAATVGVDGISTVNALGGTATIADTSDASTLFKLGGADTASVWGTDTVAFAAAAAAALVTVQDGANVVFASQAGLATPVVTLAPGTQVIGTMAGSTASVAASAGGMLMVSAWGGKTVINPGGANVTLFAGGGSETLLGAGSATLPGVTVPSGTTLANTGSDFVFSGTGYFQGGSGPLNMLMTSTVAGAATLVGGGTVDLLFSQGGGDSLVGAAGTVIMNAAGFSEPGFSVAGAAAGDVLDAGASNAFMFGSAWGANTIVAGSGAATVFGNHGATGQVGNVYVDGAAGGSLTILDFLPGADSLVLGGHTISRTVTIAVGQAGTPGTDLTLSDGTTIAFVDQFLTQNQIAAALH